MHIGYKCYTPTQVLHNEAAAQDEEEEEWWWWWAWREWVERRQQDFRWNIFRAPPAERGIFAPATTAWSASFWSLFPPPGEWLLSSPFHTIDKGQILSLLTRASGARLCHGHEKTGRKKCPPLRPRIVTYNVRHHVTLCHTSCSVVVQRCNTFVLMLTSMIFALSFSCTHVSCCNISCKRRKKRGKHSTAQNGATSENDDADGHDSDDGLCVMLLLLL